MRFSERMGIVQTRNVIQLDDMDESLRVGLYNAVHDAVVGRWFTKQGMLGGLGFHVARNIWSDFWCRPVDQMPTQRNAFVKHLKGWMLNLAPWNGVYDLLEFIVGQGLLDGARLNGLLGREMSGFRFTEDLLAPVSDPIEVAALSNALGGGPFEGARMHLQDAVEKLSQRPEPDLRNAIKEAISAVESAVRVASGMEKATLDDALKTMGHVHPALRGAWSKLYGYSSDEQGVRHAMLEDPAIDFATAKYMVVSCAAFVNYLSDPAAREES